MRTVLVAAALIAAGAIPGAAQMAYVDRQAYTFIDNQLDVVVVGQAAGVLQLVRGQNGRVEVAARNPDGLAGAGMGGTYTRELRLAAAGAGDVEYIVVVPERVSVHVRLPGGGRTSVSPGTPAATYRWDAAVADVPATDRPARIDGLEREGLFLVHASTWAPPEVDLPQLGSIRSVSVRFQGGEFQVAASRPLTVDPGGSGLLELRVTGQPLDIVIVVPRAADFVLRSGGQRLVESVAGQARALCGNAIVQRTAEDRTWVTLRPDQGRVECR